MKILNSLKLNHLQWQSMDPVSANSGLMLIIYGVNSSKGYEYICLFVLQKNLAIQSLCVIK